MSGLALVAIVVSSIFAAGVLLGVTSVISLSAAQRGTWRSWDLPHQFAGPRDAETLPDSGDYPDSTRAWPRDGHRD